MPFSKLVPAQLENLRVQLRDPRCLVFAGSITSPDPKHEVEPFLRALHEAALASGLTELRVDVRALTLVNAAAIRLFMDWATRIMASTGGAYRLKFQVNPGIPWQSVSFRALSAVAGGVVNVDWSE
jgi:hypothetical protein